MASGADLAPKLNPMSVGKTLDTAIKIYLGNAVKLWTAVAVVVIPFGVVAAAVRYLGLPASTFVQDGQLYAPYGSHISVVPNLVVELLAVLAQLLSIAAGYRIALDAIVGRTPDVGASFALAFRRLGGLIGVSLLGVLAIGIGLILLIVPGIYLMVSFCVAVPVLMMESLGAVASLQRSRELVKGRWWPTLGRLVAVYVCAGILVIVLGVLTALVTRSLSVGSVGLYVAVAAILNMLLSLLLTPFVVASITTIYVELRVRKEAFDIELVSDSGTGGATAEPAVATSLGGLPHPSESSNPFGG